MSEPNIVFMMADDMGWGDVGCNNPESQVPTPYIDRLAAEGTRFTDAHSSCALCTPTRYGLLTGRHYWRTPKKHALVKPYQPPVIEPERPTLASVLRDQGYATACVGKWHLGLLYPDRRGEPTEDEADIDFSKPLKGGPIELGFSYFFGTAGCSTSDAPYCFIEGDRTVGIPSVPSTEELHALPGFYPGLMVPDWSEHEVDVQLAAKAVEFIHSHASSRSEEPFFLYYALSAPHIPWLTPDFITGKSGDGPRGDMNVLVDWCVGQVVAALEERGILEDTLVIFTSDNGPQYNTGESGHRAAGPFRGKKNTPFEGGHREPFVARWPGQVPAGATSSQVVCLTDMFATFAELTGAALPESAAEDSFSVLPAFLGQGDCEPRPALICDTGGGRANVGDFALRRGKWKLIIAANRKTGEPAERFLFDMDNDPAEEHNLHDQQPAVVADLERLLAQCKERGLRQVPV